MPDAMVDRPLSGLIGTTLSGRYRVLRALGEGAIGRVYEVEHLRVGRKFAAKVLKAEYRSSATVLERFRREAKLGGLLKSAHTVEVVDYDEAEVPYLVMEYLEGLTLHTLLEREGALPARRAATLLIQACRGVARAHAFGVLHRDLKPSNLFVAGSEAGELCKVLDFGVAKLESSSPSSSVVPSTSTGAIIGTLLYMPPEQVRGERDLDARVDVYSLGAILYECLAGVRPFDAPTPPTIMYKILEERPRPLAELRPELPAELVACVERAMQRERDARFASVRELERALSPFGADDQRPGSASPVTAAGSYVPHEPPKPKRRARRARTYTVVGVATGLLGAAAGYAIGVRRAEPANEATAAAPETPRAARDAAGNPSTQSSRDQARAASQPHAAAREPGAEPSAAKASAERTEQPTPSRKEAAARTPAVKAVRERARPRAEGAGALASAPTASAAVAQPAPVDAKAGSGFDRMNPYRTGAEKP